MQRIWATWVVAATCLAAPAAAEAPRTLAVERLGPEHGLAHNGVAAILEDREGFLWLGTDDGLQRFDGVEFDTYRAGDPPLGLSHSRVTDLFETEDGFLWIGTAGGLDVLRADRSRLERVVEPPALQASGGTGVAPTRVAVSRIARSPRGTLTVSTSVHGIFEVIRDAGGTRLRQLLSEPAQVHEHGWTAEGDLLLLASDGGYRMLRFAAGKELVESVLLPDAGVAAEGFTPPGGGGWTSTALSRGHFVAAAGWQYRHAASLRDDGLWFASDGGLFHVAPGRSEPLPVPLTGPGMVAGGLASEIQALAWDRSGTLWLGTFGGLLRADPAREVFLRWPSDGDSPDYAVSSLAELDGGDALLVGTFGSGVLEVSAADGRLLRQISVAGLTGGRCSDFVWHALENSLGVRALVSSHAICTVAADGRLIASVAGFHRHVVTTEDGSFWVAGSPELILFAPDGRPHRDFELGAGTVRAVSPRELWLAPMVAPGAPIQPEITRFDPESGDVRRYLLPWRSSVFDLSPGPDGVLAATTEGLVRLDPESGATERLVTETEVGTVYSVERDGEAVWLGTSRGLLHADLGARPPVLRRYTAEDGLGNVEFNRRARLRTRSGRVYLGGMNGITAFDPPRLAANPFVPPTRLKSVEIEGPGGRRRVFAAAQATLAPADFAIDFSFAALNYTRADLNRYRYRLRGVDPDWVDVGTQRRARYAGLAPGSYTFEVLGSNNDGLWGEVPATFAFAVRPAFHQTWWFRAALLASAAALLAWVYRIRVRRLLEIERLRLRIATDLHDEVGSELSGIALASALVGRSDRLAPDERARLAEVEQAARQVLEGVRDIVWYVNPEHDRLESLIDRMRSTARRLTGGFAVTFAIDGLAGSTSLDMRARRPLYLAFKELLTNAARHSAGRAIEVRLARRDGSLELTVTDDGRGFDAGAGPGADGSGLASVRRRIESLGGRFEIEAGPQGGTRARVSVPLT